MAGRGRVVEGGASCIRCQRRGGFDHQYRYGHAIYTTYDNSVDLPTAGSPRNSMGTTGESPISVVGSIFLRGGGGGSTYVVYANDELQRQQSHIVS